MALVWAITLILTGWFGVPLDAAGAWDGYFCGDGVQAGAVMDRAADPKQVCWIDFDESVTEGEGNE